MPTTLMVSVARGSFASGPGSVTDAGASGVAAAGSGEEEAAEARFGARAATTAEAPEASASRTASRREAGTSTPREASHDGRPTSTPPWAVMPTTPSPGWFANAVTGSSDRPRSAAPDVIARATGCSERDSTEAARDRAEASSTSGDLPAEGTATDSRDMTPVVTVPVLSSSIVSIERVCSRISAFLMRMPSCEARPDPTRIAVGVARPSAHGHATTRTATAAVNAACTPPPASSQPPSVSRETTMTIGTNTPEIWSASRWTGALPAWASATMRPICASVVSEPTRVARTSRDPHVLTVAPVTASPGAASTGTDSPVRSEVSRAEEPSTMTPSVATFSPGRTANRSPTCRDEAGTMLSERSPVAGSTLTSVASFAPMLSSERSASPAR